MQIVSHSLEDLSFDAIIRGAGPPPDPSVTHPEEPRPAVSLSIVPKPSEHPAPDRTEPDPKPTPAGLLPFPQPPTILVVDDSISIRESLMKILLAEGYAVEHAATGDEALRQYDPDRIDLVVLDLNLPGVNGWDVFQRLVAINPSQAIILITGHCPVHRGMLPDGNGVILEKPLHVERLLESIRTILHEPQTNRLLRIEIQRSFTRLTRPMFAPMGSQGRFGGPGGWNS